MLGLLLCVLPVSGLQAELVSPLTPPVNALDSLQAAADAGDHEAQYQLSLRYFAGEGRVQSTRLGLKYLEAAAEGGQRDAQFNLGNYYNLYQENFQRAGAWWRKAAEQGLAAAQFNLGGLYENGLGVAVDRDQARYWYEQAAAQGDEAARQALAALNPPLAASAKQKAVTSGPPADGDETLRLRFSRQLLRFQPAP